MFTRPELKDTIRQCIDEIHVVFFSEGSALVRKGERYAGVYYILTGSFDVRAPEEQPTATDSGKSHAVQGLIEQGDIVGYHSLLDNNTSMLVDFAIDWTPSTTGETIERRSSAQEEELQKGDCFGIQQLFLDGEPPKTAYAIRLSEIAHIQFGTYQALSLLEPHVALSLARIGAMSSARTINSRWTEAEISDAPPPRPDFHTLAVLPLTPDGPVGEFTTELMRAIIDTGIKSERKVAILESQQTMDVFGASDIDDIEIFEVGYLPRPTGGCCRFAHFCGRWRCAFELEWTVHLALPHRSRPHPRQHEEDIPLRCHQRLARGKHAFHHTQPSALVSLSVPPIQTRTWINGSHHHILLNRPDDTTATTTPCPPLHRPHADLHRLARLLFGKVIGLVLGGGGARGMAHLGFIRALEEAGVPVDIVGGTSMGACAGAVYARELNWRTTLDAMRGLAARCRFWRAVPDVTYPHVAGTTGAAFQAMVRAVFGTGRIEDLWLGYYCAVTNLSRNGAQTQSYGDATRSIVVSMSYPGLVQPTCVDGELLLDGCFTSNLPVARARMLGASTVFVVDVSPIDPLEKFEYGETISGWKIQLDRLTPGRKGGDPIPPTMDDILARLTLSPSIAEVEAVKRSPHCHYVSLPVGQYSATDFGKFDDLVEVSYEYSKRWLRRNIGSTRTKDEGDGTSII
ncbi:acyl transferase/acyl hydrolase/lysophospholipase [Coniochaeta sp. 2T2.1]|nr:acyl transferase/acyl hydrolase/lysophospholipase [Coniochaeta sp. 2T2.1]